jgi:acyl carrier protein
MTVQERVRGYVLESFYVSDPAELTEETSLIDSGIVDSTGMVEVILFLEAEYGFHVEDDETVPENLETITRIAAYVDRKRAPAAG